MLNIFTNVKSSYVTVAASVVNARGRLRGYHIVNRGGADGTVAFGDGAATILRIGVTSTLVPVTMTFNDGGIIFETGLAVSVPASVNCTVFYD